MTRDKQHANGHRHDANNGRGRGHDHAHGPGDYGWAFAIGISLNIVFVLVEAIYGWLANSMALLADAGHNLSDVLGLVIAWGASLLAKRAPSLRFTYGLRSSSILAALANAILLAIAVGAIAWEAIHRLTSPSQVAGTTVIVVAAIGVVINTVTALLFMSGQKQDINIRGAFLHMAADAAVSVGVVVAGLIILFTGWHWVDPVVSLAICGVITWGTWWLLRDSVRMALNGVPPDVDPMQVRSFLSELKGVAKLHDLHIWPMSTTETALTCHLVIPSGHPGDAFLTSAAQELKERFNIEHVTLQIEVGDDLPCALEADSVV